MFLKCDATSAATSDVTVHPAMSALLLLVKDLRLQTVAPERALALDTDWCPSSIQEFPRSPSLVPAAVLASEQTRELPSEFPSAAA